MLYIYCCLNNARKHFDLIHILKNNTLDTDHLEMMMLFHDYCNICPLYV